MTTPEMLDALLERLPQLRAHGVTHVSVDPASGAVSMLIAPKLPDPVVASEGEKAAQVYDDGSTFGLPPGTPMPRSFRERRASMAPQVK